MKIQAIYTSSRFTVVCVNGGTELKDGVGDGTELKDGDGGGSEFKVGDGGGSVGVGGGGPLIVVGPPTGPEQTSPLGQQPMFPLLATAQYVL